MTLALAALARRDQWILLPRTLLSQLGPTGAVLLCALIEHHRTREALGHSDDGWVRITTKQLCSFIPQVPVQEAWKELDTLREEGLILYCVRGPTRRRERHWVRLRTENIDAILSGAPPPRCIRLRRRSEAPGPSADPARATHCEHCSSVDWNALGAQLRNAVGSVRMLPASAKAAHWGAGIRGVHTADNVELDRLRAVLDWYCTLIPNEGDLISNGNPHYVPIAYSGRSFREKFDKLEGCMVRMEGGETRSVKVKRVRRESTQREDDDTNYYGNDV